MNSRIRRVVAVAAIASIAGSALPQPAQAETIRTDAALSSTQRERIAEVLARPDVQAQLQAYGVEPAEAKARVAALSDEEAAVLAAHIETLPAGARAEAFLTLLLVVVLLPVILVGGAIFLAAKVISAGNNP